MKSNLLLRPVFHRLEQRIRAHVLICWLALLLVRVAERQTESTWRRIATELGRVHAVALTGSAGTAVHTTPLTTTQAGIYRGCRVRPTGHPRPGPELTRQNTPARTPARVGTRLSSLPSTVSAGHDPNPTQSCAHQLRKPGDAVDVEQLAVPCSRWICVGAGLDAVR